MSVLRNCAIAALMLAAASAFAADPRMPRLVAYDAGEFTIVTSRGSSQARQFIEDLVKFRITFEKMLNKRAVPSPFPTHIVILSAGDWRRYLEPRQNIAGFFQSARFANYMALDGDAERWFVTPLMFHEYSHYYLASQFSGEYPPWFNEGLAELMAYTMFTDKGQAILRIPSHQVQEARDGDWIPFDRLIRIGNYSMEYQSHKLASSFYAQAWLTVHYGMLENREFRIKMVNYLNELNKLRPQPDAARIAFGDDLAAIDKQLRDYSRQSNKLSGVLTLGDVPRVELPAGKPVAENDAYAIIINLMFDAHLIPDRIRPLVDALARREPAAARAAIFQARLATLDDDGAKFTAAVEKARANLAADDWVSRRELAAVLLDSALAANPLSKRTSADDDRDLNAAMILAGQAVAHNNQDIEALWAFGTASARLDKNLDVAEDALVAAYKLAPSSAEIAVSLANLMGRRQKPDAMIPYLKDTIRFATDLGTRRWAVDTLDDMEKYIAERDQAEEEDRKQQEAYEKQRADYEKKYGKPRK